MTLLSQMAVGAASGEDGRTPRERCYVQNPQQRDRYTSPWSLAWRLRMLLWVIVSAVAFRPTPKPLSGWRVFLLRCFGAHISGQPFVSQSAIIKYPC